MEEGKNIYQKILLTSAGFEDLQGELKPNITACFLRLLEKPAKEAKVLFIPAAAIEEEELKMADWCYLELLHIGILPENIRTYNLEYEITIEEAMSFDVVYFTGGNTRHLLKVLKGSGFFSTVKKLVYRNKLYVGVSAGSLIATPNIALAKEEDTEGLCLIQAYLNVHCLDDSRQRKDLPLPHVCLKDNQAILVTGNDYRLIED
jgi:peptidase E